MVPPAALSFPQVDPFIFKVGKLGLSWYAFMYVLGFAAAFFFLRYRYRKGALRLKTPDGVSLLVTYLFYGLILGARLGYVLFYNLKYYIERPLEIPAIWHGGMSFHGGLVGCVLAMWLFSRREQASFYNVADNCGMIAPIGLFFGRIGNFINGELYGRATDLPWGVVFPRGGPLPRHPSQLYEAILEGLVLFLVLWITSKLQKRDGMVSAMLLIGYGILRFPVEFVREPDPQLGTVLGPLTMGQLLCLAMVAAGLGVMAWVLKYQPRYLSGKAAQG